MEGYGEIGVERMLPPQECFPEPRSRLVDLSITFPELRHIRKTFEHIGKEEFRNLVKQYHHGDTLETLKSKTDTYNQMERGSKIETQLAKSWFYVTQVSSLSFFGNRNYSLTSF